MHTIGKDAVLEVNYMRQRFGIFSMAATAAAFGPSLRTFDESHLRD